MSQIRHNDLQTCSHTSTEEHKALQSSTKLCVSHFCLTFYYAKKDKPETKRRHRHVNGRITYQELTNRLNDVEVLTCKIGNGWKSFNTHTIEKFTSQPRQVAYNVPRFPDQLVNGDMIAGDNGGFSIQSNPGGTVSKGRPRSSTHFFNLKSVMLSPFPRH